jgi:folate-binding protein YgfZ
MEAETLPSLALAGARLARYGALSVSGEDARAFLHAQLTSDVEHLAPRRAALAGWCSAKGRLLASFLVVARGDGFLLQLARDLAPAVAKRLSMFILRSKVKLQDASDAWVQLGLWGAEAARRLAAAGFEVPEPPFAAAARGELIAVRHGAGRFLVLAPSGEAAAFEREIGAPDAGEQAWALEEIRAGRPLISAATQDLFVPQMVNLEALGGVDFHKGCYPGQEIVARTQHRGQLKRRMVRARLGGAAAHPGQELFADEHRGQASGTIVDAAGGEMLAVVPIGSTPRLAPGGPPLEILPLPYSA